MKNLLFIIAITFGVYSFNVQASNKIPNSDSNLLVKVERPSLNLFCTSIAKGDTEIVKRLIDMGEDVNEKSKGLTPAMYAAKYNRVEILQILISQGADLTVKGDRGYTALDYAKATNAFDAQNLIEATLAK